MKDLWLQALWKVSQDSVASSSLPNALALRGNKGLGKTGFLRSLAQMILCHNSSAGQACGHCHSCQVFEANSHPDFTLLCLQNLSPTIDDVRVLQKWLASKPSLSSSKVILLGDISSYSVAVANALLKSIEEPKSNCFFLAYDPCNQKLLPTIQSRFQFWPIEGPNQAYCLQWLGEQKQTRVLSSESFESCYHLCRGAPYEILEFVREGKLEQLQTLLAAWRTLEYSQLAKILADKKQQWAIDALILDLQLSLKRQSINAAQQGAATQSKIDVYQRLIDFKREFQIHVGLNADIQISNLTEDLQDMMC